MTLGAASEIEVRTTGSQTNGGGFNPSGAGAGTDYTRQAEPVLLLSDIASDVAGTGISSVTGGFTAAMVRNWMYIPSTGGFSEGWYEITAYSDTNNITIDRSAGSSKSGGACTIGGAWKWGGTKDQLMFNTLAPGNHMWVQAGTYTYSGSFNTGNDGTADAPIVIEGYQETRGDQPTGSDRPVISVTGYCVWDDFWRLHFLSIVGTPAAPGPLVHVGNGSTLYQTKIYNTATTGSHYALQTDSSGLRMLLCELQCDSSDPAGAALYLEDFGYYFYGCSFQGSSGIYVNSGSNWPSQVTECLFKSCTVAGIGFVTGTHRLWNLKHNIFYNCTLGIGNASDTTLQICQIMNNIFSECDDGVLAPHADSGENIILNNVFDVTNSTYDGDIAVIDAGNLTGDPEFLDPANGKFSIAQSSIAFNAAADVGDYTNATV